MRSLALVLPLVLLALVPLDAEASCVSGTHACVCLFQEAESAIFETDAVHGDGGVRIRVVESDVADGGAPVTDGGIAVGATFDAPRLPKEEVGARTFGVIAQGEVKRRLSLSLERTISCTDASGPRSFSVDVAREAVRANAGCAEVLIDNGYQEFPCDDHSTDVDDPPNPYPFAGCGCAGVSPVELGGLVALGGMFALVRRRSRRGARL